MKRQLLIGVALSFIVGMFAGCSGTGTGSTSGGKTPGNNAAGAENVFSNLDLSNGIQISSEETEIVCTLSLIELGGDKVLDDLAKAYPTIKVKIEPMMNGDTKLLSMIAAGNGPDLIRVGGFDELPSMVNRGLLAPLDDVIAASGKVDLSDLMPINDLFRFDGKERGQGPLYGVVKDWSIDNNIWINKEVFESAGEPIPSDTEPMTYTEFARLAQKLMKKNGDSVERFGVITYLPVVTLTEAMLASQGHSLWKDDYTSSNMKEQYVVDALNYWADLQKSGALASTLYPTNDQNGIGSLKEGKTAMVIGGYWLSQGFNDLSDAESENFMMLPAPVAEGGEQVNASLVATGLGIFSQTQHPMEAYAVWEYLMLSEEAISHRIQGGWGIPPINSMVDDLLSETPLQKQALELTKRQIPTVSMKPRVNPYLLYTGLTTEFDKYYNLFLYDEMTLEQALDTIDKDIGYLIEEGMEMAAG